MWIGGEYSVLSVHSCRALFQRLHWEVQENISRTWQKYDKPSDFQGRCLFVKFDPSHCGADIFPQGPSERKTHTATPGSAGHP